MIKVNILDCCEYCDGKAYAFVCEDVDTRGELFDRDRSYEMCDGRCNQAKWAGLVLQPKEQLDKITLSGSDVTLVRDAYSPELT